MRREPVFAATPWPSLFASLETGTWIITSGTLALDMTGKTGPPSAGLASSSPLLPLRA